MTRNSIRYALLASTLLICAPMWGQTYSDVIIGGATECVTVKFQKSGTGLLNAAKTTGCNKSSASITGSANIGGGKNLVKLTAKTSGKFGGATGSGSWGDYVTFLPPADYTDDTAKFTLYDTYSVTVTGGVPKGLIAASVLYIFPTIGVSHSTLYYTDVKSTVTAAIAFSITKGASGFSTAYGIAVGVGAGGAGTSSSSVTEPVSAPVKGFVCPTSGWKYTLASRPGLKFTCASVPAEGQGGVEEPDSDSAEE